MVVSLLWYRPIDCRTIICTRLQRVDNDVGTNIARGKWSLVTN